MSFLEDFRAFHRKVSTLSEADMWFVSPDIKPFEELVLAEHIHADFFLSKIWKLQHSLQIVILFNDYNDEEPRNPRT